MGADEQPAEEGARNRPENDMDGDHGDSHQSISTSSGARSISTSDSHISPGNREDLEEHRNMMLASLLEDYLRTRAAEFLNMTAPNMNYTRDSHEVQSLAKQLFNETGRKLTSNGILPGFTTSDAAGSTRRQYLTALDGVVAKSRASAPDALGPLDNLVLRASELALVPNPANDFQLTRQPLPDSSHYRSSFREVALLGKGGFGKVYQCFNPLDNRAYAVKKIPIPSKLGARFRDGKREDIQHILREVQALANLDHPNIVRYHATWFEEPRQPSLIMNTQGLSRDSGSEHRGQLLLDSQPFSQKSEEMPESSLSGGVIFEDDESSAPEDKKLVAEALNWPEEPTSSCSEVETSSTATASDAFTDGKGYIASDDRRRDIIDGNGYTLYIQMSLYPMTLAQYIAGSIRGKESMRHCFHLTPSLRLLDAIHGGLQYIHSKGYIHRDIKPGNIFLSSPELESQGGYCDLSCNSCSGRAGTSDVPPRWLNARIGDFGLVAELAHGKLPPSPYAIEGAEMTLGKPVGTAYYRPPRSSDNNDEKVDMFALGIVFVELLCPCDTVMERVDMLAGLQRGCVPSTLEGRMEAEGYSAGLIQEVISLAKAMVDPDSRKRWSSTQVDKAITSILGQCENAKL
ncbi:kinase-like protein [Hypoxylon sp. FL1284]|nr:kinase-like protein [Hypoxylon sp. FL1284]